MRVKEAMSCKIITVVPETSLKTGKAIHPEHGTSPGPAYDRAG